MEQNFLPNNFFDLSGFPYPQIFEGVESVWEVLPKLAPFIKSQTASEQKNIFIGEGTIIEEGALIKGPALIGRNCFIGHGAYLRENCLLGDNVRIGHGAEVKNSLVLSGSTIAHLNYVGDSIIGNNVNFGGGAIVANFRLDGQSVKIKVKDGVAIDTGLLKLGAVVGDNGKVGVNAVLNPGTILGKNCLVYPLTSVVGNFETGAIIK